MPLSRTASIEKVGAKAFNLNKLVKLGFSVPDALILPTFDAGHLGIADLSQYISAIEDFSPTLADAIPSSHGWAVRSSNTNEDLISQSMAGFFDTLFIRKTSELSAAVKDVWLSAEKANLSASSMGVIVQKLINADFAGVAFSENPTNSSNKPVIELCPGKADQLVDGKVTPWIIDLKNEKHRLPEAFDPKLITQITQGMERLVSHFGYAVDVEWAIENNNLYWLQVRPLTTKVETFSISEEQKRNLSGVWLRMKHCFTPQMPLVISLDPGGYINFPDWQSQMVNQFHFIKLNKTATLTIKEEDFDNHLDHWDKFEKDYEHLLQLHQSNDLSLLDNKQLVEELEQRIVTKKAIYKEYMAAPFYYIRDKSHEKVENFVSQAFTDEINLEEKTSQLLLNLDTKTEKKQQQLRNLAAIFDGDITVQQTPEWTVFLQQYGFESASTHLFYLPTLKETPDLLLAMLEHFNNYSTENKSDLDWQVALQTVQNKLPKMQSEQFLVSVKRLRRCIKRTEDDDYLLQKATALVRYVILEIGSRLQSIGLLTHIDDVFYLHWDEITDQLTSQTKDLSELKSNLLRRANKFRINKQLSSPAMIINGRQVTPKNKKNEELLSGTPASPGVATGVVYRVNNPFDLTGLQLPKNAVIVVPIITPAFAYNLIGCAAVITEVGGLASHGAIIAREMGIPAVVGIKGARESLSTGMKVSVDGSTGKVRLID